MKFNLKLATRLFLSVTPLITGSVFVASPSLAASESCALASVDFSLFSHNPFEIITDTDTNTFTEATDGSAQSFASAEATFLTAPIASTSTAFNISDSNAKGDGNSYFGIAQSFAGLGGYKFNVGAGETFSFNFTSFLSLDTFTDNASNETADSLGQIVFQIYENTEDSSTLLDWFSLSGNLTSSGDTDFIESDRSKYIYHNSNNVFSDFGGTNESAKALIQGNYSRTFANQTSLSLIETKITQTSVGTFNFLSSLTPSILN